MTKSDHQKRKAPKKPTLDRVRNQAMHHLERYATASGHLKSLLYRRNLKAAHEHGLDEGDLKDMVDQVVDRLVDVKLIDDRLYAESRARSLTREGRSKRGIAARLQQKQVSADDVDAALDQLVEENPAHELEAAITHARRRRLGPYRAAEKRDEFRDKDLASFARAGFGFSMAQKVVDAETVDQLEELLEATRQDFVPD